MNGRYGGETKSSPEAAVRRVPRLCEWSAHTADPAKEAVRKALHRARTAPRGVPSYNHSPPAASATALSGVALFPGRDCLAVCGDASFRHEFTNSYSRR